MGVRGWVSVEVVCLLMAEVTACLSALSATYGLRFFFCNLGYEKALPKRSHRDGSDRRLCVRKSA